MAFNAQGLLDQVLRAGQQMMAQGQTQSRSRSSRGLSSALGGSLGRGALATGALGLLLGNKRRRGLGGGMISHGGAAMLGVLAYRAFQNWQAQQGQTAPAEPRTLDRVSGDEADKHSLAILRAVIAAAKADGHIDEREQQLIDAEAAKGGEGSELQRWLEQELRRPVDPAAVAAEAESPEIAAEMYLASRLVVDTESYMERAYLDELARALQLDPGLRAQLDQQAEEASASRH